MLIGDMTAVIYDNYNRLSQLIMRSGLQCVFRRTVAKCEQYKAYMQLIFIYYSVLHTQWAKNLSQYG